MKMKSNIRYSKNLNAYGKKSVEFGIPEHCQNQKWHTLSIQESWEVFLIANNINKKTKTGDCRNNTRK